MNILKLFFWDYNGQGFFDYVFYNVDGFHFDVNPVVVLWVTVFMVTSGVITLIVHLIRAKMNPTIRKDERLKNKWKRGLIAAMHLIIIGVAIFFLFG